MKLWRIAAETRSYKSTDLSGRGAALAPGRWNEANQPVLYCAVHLSLAVLETIAHIEDGGFPQNRFIVEIDVPKNIWDARQTLDVTRLRPSWTAIPAGLESIMAGSRWIKSLRSAVLIVPSSIIPEEAVALINPAHPGAATITARDVRGIDYKRVLRGA